MPLKQGYSQKTISHNIGEMHHNSDHFAKVARLHGKKVAHKMAIAAALDTARKAKKKRHVKKSAEGGPIKNLDLVIYLT